MYTYHGPISPQALATAGGYDLETGASKKGGVRIDLPRETTKT
jgi:hypothetical protein